MVRRGTPADVAAISELIERVDHDRFERTEAEWDAVRQRLGGVLSSGETVTFVAEDGGIVVGELLAVPRRSGVVGIAVSVAEGSRRRGVATALFEAVIEWARDAGYAELELDVQESNEPARALYAKVGFVDTGQPRRGERGSVLIMRKSLSHA
jgi:GNAT superfamily N-acetyltransferase